MIRSRTGVLIVSSIFLLLTGSLFIHDRTRKTGTELIATAGTFQVAPIGFTGWADNSIEHLIVATDSRLQLNRRIWTFSTSDIFYRKGLTPFDVTGEDYLSIVRSLRPYALAFSEGKTSDWARQVVGDTLLLGGAGNGYNIPSWVPADILQGMSSHRFYMNGQSYDFFNAYVKMLHEIPARGYVLGNIMTGTCKEVIWMISRANPEYVQLGLEQMRGAAFTEYWKSDPSRYKKKFNSWVDSIHAVFPDVRIIADIPPSHSDNSVDQAWRKELQTGLKADGVRDYWHLHWMAKGRFSGNLEKDRLIMESIFKTVIPELIKKNKELFPTKELVVDQWSVSLTGDGGRNPYKRTFFATGYIPRMAQFMIEYNRDHDNVIGSAKYENIKQLIGNKGISSMEYEVTKMIANLFSDPGTVLNISHEMPGTAIFGIRSGKSYKLILFNDQPKSVQLPAQIICDGNPLSYTLHAALSSPSAFSTEWTFYSTKREIRPFSIAYIVAE